MDYKTQYQMYLSQASAALEDACAKFLPEESEVCRAARYSLLGGGKRIRAVLVLSVCDMLGGNMQAAEQFAAKREILPIQTGGEMRNLTLVNRAYCIRNPKHYKGFGADCWGLTASYSVDGYAAHAPNEGDDRGVISPTAALSSIVYTPEYSLQVMRHLYGMGDKVFGPYGFYDAFSETDNWYPQRYLAIDQGPIAVMIENYRSGLLWKLFMSHPDVQQGLRKLGFTFAEAD